MKDLIKFLTVAVVLLLGMFILATTYLIAGITLTVWLGQTVGLILSLILFIPIMYLNVKYCDWVVKVFRR